MHPLKLIINFFSGWFVLGLIALEIYLIREWNLNRYDPYQADYSRNMLLAASALLLFMLFGRFLFSLILSRPGKDEPDQGRSADFQELPRPEGGNLHVEFYGPKDAQPVIMLHGWSSNLTQWYYFKKVLSLDYRLVLVDMPGLGKSGKPNDNNYSLDRFARDLNDVIALCGPGAKPVVLGHSIGGMTILTACKNGGAAFYEKISGIVLLHTTYTDPSKTSIMSGLLTALERPVFVPLLHIMIALAPLFQLMNWLKFLNGSMHTSNRITGFAGTQTRGQLNLTAFLSTIAPVDVVSRGCLAMFDYDATSVLPLIKTPVLIVTGENDILTKPIASQFMAMEIPGARIVELKNDAHMGVLERHDAMISAVSAFLEGIVLQGPMNRLTNSL